MGIVIIIYLFIAYVLPFMAFLSWIFRFTVIVRENEEKEMAMSFKKTLKETLGRCYGFWISGMAYIVGAFMLSSDIYSYVRGLFSSDGIVPFGSGYFFVGYLLIGGVYSFVFYKRHSR